MYICRSEDSFWEWVLSCHLAEAGSPIISAAFAVLCTLGPGAFRISTFHPATGMLDLRCRWLHPAFSLKLGCWAGEASALAESSDDIRLIFRALGARNRASVIS